MIARLFVTLAATALLAAPAAAQREAPPAVGTPKAFHLAPTTSFTLPNGLQVTLVPFGTVPKVTIRLAQRFGSLNERRDTWLANVTADLLAEGTTARSAAQINEQLAGMGGNLSVNSGADETNITTEVLSERAADALAIVADVALKPALPGSELARIRANRLRQLAIAKTQSGSLAQEAFRDILYGDHPYGRVLPTEAQLQGYTIEQVRAFYTGNAGAQRAHLYVAGVFDRAAVERAIRIAFAGWAKGPVPLIDPPKSKSGRVLRLVDRPKAVQSTVIVGLPVPSPTSPDATALEVTDAILGGTFGSRITTNIREQKGYTYSPFSQISERYQNAHWAEIADVTTNVTGPSLKEIFAEIDRLRTQAPPADELRGVENNLVGIFTIQNSSRGGIIGQLQYANLHGLGERYVTEYTKRVLAVTPAQVQKTMQTYFDPAKMAIVVVGDTAVINQQVAPYRAVVP